MPRTVGGGTFWRTGRRAGIPPCSTSTGKEATGSRRTRCWSLCWVTTTGGCSRPASWSWRAPAPAVTVRYRDMELPVSPRSLDELLAAAARRAGSEALGRIAEGYGALPTSRLTDEAAVSERHEQHQALRRQLEELLRADGSVAPALDDEIEALNADPDRLDALLRRQNYRLAHWRTASEELDYRRFFNIESLIGVRVEDPEVFARTHRLIVELVKEGTVDGLRVDHVDGLRDPEKYLNDLAVATGGAYTVVEKILEPGETLRPSWPVAGTSGYDFLIRVNNLFVESRNEAAMTADVPGCHGGNQRATRR